MADYENFCKELKAKSIGNKSDKAITNEQFKAFLEEQKNGMLDCCPRCGEKRMRTPANYNCLSRQADIYVCEVCGAEEAIFAMQGKEMPLEYWDLAARMI